MEIRCAILSLVFDSLATAIVLEILHLALVARRSGEEPERRNAALLMKQVGEHLRIPPFDPSQKGFTDELESILRLGQEYFDAACREGSSQSEAAAEVRARLEAALSALFWRWEKAGREVDRELLTDDEPWVALFTMDIRAGTHPFRHFASRLLCATRYRDPLA